MKFYKKKKNIFSEKNKEKNFIIFIKHLYDTFYSFQYSFLFDLFTSLGLKKRTKQRLIFSTKIYFSKQFIKQSQIIRQAFLV